LSRARRLRWVRYRIVRPSHPPSADAVSSGNSRKTPIIAEKRCGFGAVSSCPQQTSHPRMQPVHAWDRVLANRGPSNDLSAVGSSNSARTRSTSISSRSWVFRRTRSFSVVIRVACARRRAFFEIPDLGPRIDMMIAIRMAFGDLCANLVQRVEELAGPANPRKCDNAPAIEPAIGDQCCPADSAGQTRGGVDCPVP